MAHATLYSTLEPCSPSRVQRRRTCTELILAAGIPRVLLRLARAGPVRHPLREAFELLAEGGRRPLLELPDFAAAAREEDPNVDVLGQF